MRRAITLLAAVLLSGQAFAAKDTFFVGVEGLTPSDAS